MLPGIDPNKMKAVMRQMGISQENIDAIKVTIETEDHNIIISNPHVTKIKMQGETSFQITGDISTEDSSSNEDHTEEDLATIIEKTGATKAEAKKALTDAKGDLTEAILNLS